MTAACLAHATMLAMVLFAPLSTSQTWPNRIALAFVGVGFGVAVSLSWCAVEGWVL